jgi:hypothetical protein
MYGTCDQNYRIKPSGGNVIHRDLLSELQPDETRERSEERQRHHQAPQLQKDQALTA